MKTREIPPLVSNHAVLEINQHNIYDWLSESPEIIEEIKNSSWFNGNPELLSRREVVKKLNPEFMEYITSVMSEYLVETGAYDNALKFVAESGLLSGVFK